MRTGERIEEDRHKEGQRNQKRSKDEWDRGRNNSGSWTEELQGMLLQAYNPGCCSTVLLSLMGSTSCGCNAVQVQCEQLSQSQESTEPQKERGA